jgi:urea transporter
MKSGWSRAATRHPVLDFLDIALRGSGQVIFMDNPLTGALNFLALFWGAYAGGTTLAVAMGSVIGTLVSTAVACMLPVDRATLRKGLYGFNGMLVGVGIPTFVGQAPIMWWVLIFAAAATPVVTLAVNNVFKVWKTPGLTFPFILTTWLVVLMAHRLPELHVIGLSSPALLPHAGDAFGFQAFVRASLASVAQVYFVDNPVSGAIFLLALLVESRWCAGLAAAGAMIAVACALAAGADAGTAYHGLWGYSAALTAPAVGCVYLKVTPGTLAYCLAATLFTVLAQGAIAALAAPLGIPALTFPFVLTTWLFLIARYRFEAKAEG